MKNKLLLLLLTTVCVALMVVPQVHSQNKNIHKLDELLPVDPEVTVGHLSNGLTYIIRENRKPENRAELRLVVNAGSILEDEDQQGLAHFVEHMAFNGTKHFAKQEIVDYLESIGMKFGPEINAYTSFDETVYMLEVPTDTAGVLEKAFQILEDWAHLVSFEDEEIDKERGVIIEEWRLGRGATARIRDKQFPVLFKGSRYAERLPIGKKEILETFRHDVLRRFYRDWYRPDLMAVIAVGDFDKQKIETLIKTHFSRIPPVEKTRKRVFYPVPDHDETLFAIATDPEAPGSQVGVYYKMDVEEEKTVADYRKSILSALHATMLNQRLSELLNQKDPPFIYAFVGKMPLVRTKQAYAMVAMVKNNAISRGLEAVLTEAERVKRFGFTKSELKRAKQLMLRSMEQAYKEREKTESVSYANEYVRHILNKEPIPGIEYEREIYQQVIPDITLEEVNDLTSSFIKNRNRVVMVSGPEKEDVRVPSKEELAAIFDKVSKMEIQPYEDKVTESPLVENPPNPGRILFERKIDELGLTEWKLSNGMKVVLKPTTFKNDEVRFEAFSPGGHSLVPDKDYFAASSAATVISEGGVGKFDKIQLGKLLTGKIVSVYPYISELYEGFSGMASPQDLETLFELIYLYFTAPRKDSTAFISYQNRMMAILENKERNPESAFGDTIQVIMAQHHFRARPLTKELLKEMDLEKSFRIYKDRFADASDFTFFFVGNFKPEELKPFVKKYLASLPALKRKESWKDVGIRPPKGVIHKVVRKGIEPKSRVSIIFTGPYEYSRQNNYNLMALADIMEIKLREVLREDMGGTYGVGVSASVSKYPYEGYRLSISFGCDPERVEELVRAIFVQIDSLKQFGIKEIYVKKVTEADLRAYETNLKENGYWLSALSSAYRYGLDPKDILTFPERVKNLTPGKVKELANKVLNTNNYIQVVLKPEK